MIKAYRRTIWLNEKTDETLLHMDNVLTDDVIVRYDEMSNYKFETFDEFLEFCRKHKPFCAEVQNFGKNSYVFLNYWGEKHRVTRSNWSPSFLVVEYQEYNPSIKQLLDMDAEKVIKYIKERW